MPAPLKLRGLDHVVRAVPDLEPAWEAMQRLGLNAVAPGPAADTGELSTYFSVGGPENGVAVEFVSLSPQALDDPRKADLAALIKAGGGMHLVAFGVDDLGPAREMFAALGGFEETEIRPSSRPGRAPGAASEALEAAPIRSLRPLHTDDAGCRFVILEYPPAVREQQRDLSRYRHEIPIKRFDHVAVIPKDFDASLRFWTEVMGAKAEDELTVSDILVRRVRVGDGIIELLKPGPASPLAGAEGGLRPTLSCEVDDLDAVVASLRARGFKALDPIVMGSEARISTIAPKQTAGLTFQFLQYL